MKKRTTENPYNKGTHKKKIFFSKKAVYLFRFPVLKDEND